MQFNNQVKQYIIYNYLVNRKVLGILLPKKINSNTLKISFSKNIKSVYNTDIDDDKKKEYLDQIIASIYILHSSRIIHRSINFNSFVIKNDKLYLTLGNNFTFHFQSNSYKKIKNKYCNPNQWMKSPFISPELRNLEDENINYGMELDIWNIGLVMFNLIFQDDLPCQEPTGKDLEDYYYKNKSKWINIPDGDIYIKIIKHMLALEPDGNVIKRITAYAAKNMAEIPNTMIYNKDIQTYSQTDEKVDYNAELLYNNKLFLDQFVFNNKNKFDMMKKIIFNHYHYLEEINDIKDLKDLKDLNDLNDINDIDKKVECKSEECHNLLNRIKYALASNISNSVEFKNENEDRHKKIEIPNLLFILKVISEMIICEYSETLKDYKKFDFNNVNEINDLILFILQNLPTQVRLL